MRLFKRNVEGGGCHGRRFMHAFGRGERGPGGWGRGGRSRFFDSGDLRLVILQLLESKPSHGYELIKEIEDRLAGAYSPSPGVVYPTLTMLEDLGLASVQEASGGRKLYALTDAGRAELAANRANVDAIFGRIEQAASARGGSLPQIMRAVHNLRSAIRLRLTRGGLTDEQVRHIVNTLDAAAVAIERS